MGEYVKINGTETKIGTCESLYYTTAKQFKNALPEMTCEGSMKPSEYLTSGEFRFRFPFPDEDNIGIGEHDEFNRGYLIHLNRKDPDVEALFPRADQEWPEMTGRLTSSTQGHLSAYAKAKNPNIGGDSVHIEIVAQKAMKNGTLAVVWRDPYSGNMCRIENPEEAITLARAILHTVNPKYGSKQQIEFIMELCRRITEGYGVTFDNPEPELIEN